MTNDNRYEVVVMGGGPAGSTTAALVAEAGLSTLLVEREKMPRWHVGESLMPETWWTLQRLGVIDRLKQSDFVRKIGVQFVSPSGRQSQPFYFTQHDPRECAQTWHVERAHFDHLLFETAADKGAICKDQTRVTGFELSGTGEHSVCLQAADGQRWAASTKVIVDATGQHALLANRLGLRSPNPKLRKAAIWGHFRGAARERINGCEVTSILYTKTKKCWFWYIPLCEDKVSVGLVGDHDYLLRNRGTPAEVFQEELQNCLGLPERLSDASPAGSLQVAKEFSYTTTQHAGDGWVLVGDAFGFLDPIYSTGVLLALKSGELAADAIVDGLRSGDVSAPQLGRWTSDFNRSVALFRKLVEAYYTDEFSFADFIKQHPEHQHNLTDLLIGRAFNEGADRMFADLDPLLENLKA